MISGEFLKNLKEGHVVIHQKPGSTAKPSSLSDRPSEAPALEIFSDILFRNDSQCGNQLQLVLVDVDPTPG